MLLVGVFVGFWLGGLFAYTFFCIGRTQAVAEIEAKERLRGR